MKEITTRAFGYRIGDSFSGRTSDSDSGNGGSNPSSPTTNPPATGRITAIRLFFQNTPFSRLPYGSKTRHFS